MDGSMASLQDFSFIAFFITSITIILVVTLSTLTVTRIKNLPPGPWKLPVIGNLHHLIVGAALPHRRLRDLAEKHGRHVMHLQLGELSCIVVSSPEAARQVLRLHDHAFSSRPYLLAADIIFYGTKGIGFTPAGDHWRRMRKICVAELLTANRVLSFRPIRESEASKLVGVIRSRSSPAVDVTKLLASVSSSFTFRTAFGIAKELDEATFSKLVADISDAAGGFRVSDLFPSLKFLPSLTGFRAQLTRMHLATDAMLDDIIHEHQARRSGRETKAAGSHSDQKDADLVDVLLDLLENPHLLEVPLTMEATKAVILEIFLDGTETSTTTMEWTMSELMKNPNVMRQVQDEVRLKFHDKGVVSEEGLQDLRYLDAVIQESLRLHPPLPLLLPKEGTERIEIQGYNIPAKTRGIINVWAIGRDPRNWKEVDNFYPERFLDDYSTDYKGTDFKFIPFGAGRRSCPGVLFGMAVVRLMLANMLYHFDWELPRKMKAEDLDMTERFGASVRRKHNLYLIPVAFDPM